MRLRHVRLSCGKLHDRLRAIWNHSRSLLRDGSTGVIIYHYYPCLNHYRPIINGLKRADNGGTNRSVYGGQHAVRHLGANLFSHSVCRPLWVGKTGRSYRRMHCRCSKSSCGVCLALEVKWFVCWWSDRWLRNYYNARDQEWEGTGYRAGQHGRYQRLLSSAHTDICTLILLILR